MDEHGTPREADIERLSRVRARLGLVARRSRNRLSQMVFERRLNLDTAGAILLEELGLDEPDRVFYEPSPWMSLGTALRRGKVSGDDVFIDLGSGKGRVVTQAAEHPFRRVIGVELSPEINRIARANVEANRERLKCQDIELVTADLVDYDIPDDVTIAYCFNPVTGAVFAALLAKLLESLDRRPRRLRLIYTNPKEQDAVLRTGRARLVKDYQARFHRRHRICVYELLASS